MVSKDIISKRDYKAVYAVDGQIVKRFKPGFDLARIFNEALNQSYMEKTSINVPKILKVEPDETGAWAIYSEQIAGKTIGELIKLHPENTDKYLEIFVDLQVEMQKIEVPYLKPFQAIFHSSLVTSNEFLPTIRFGLLQEYLRFPKNHKIIHFDFSFSNIVIDGNNKPWIIDWSHAVSGTGAVDAINTFIWLNTHGYQNLSDKYLELYAGKSGIAQEELLLWKPIVAAVIYTGAPAKDKKYLWKLISQRGEQENGL